jgi:hypothetical protein
MPEQADPTPAVPCPGVQPVVPSDAGSVRPARDDFFGDEEVLECTPAQKEFIEEILWALEQQAKGLFDAYEGKYVAILHKTVYAVGVDISAMRAETAAKAGVRPERVAIYLVEAFEIY